MKTFILFLGLLNLVPCFSQKLTCTIKSDVTGEPLAGILVEFGPMDKNPMKVMQRTTNEQGVVVFDSLIRGSYRLACKHPDWSGNTYLISMTKKQSKEEVIRLSESLAKRLKQYEAITTTEGMLQAQMSEQGKKALDLQEVMTPEEIANFNRYLASNVRYPQSCIELGEEGTVIFLVKMDENNRILKMAFQQHQVPEMDAEAFRVIATMPTTLFKKPSKAGEYFYVVEVRFILQ